MGILTPQKAKAMQACPVVPEYKQALPPSLGEVADCNGDGHAAFWLAESYRHWKKEAEIMNALPSHPQAGRTALWVLPVSLHRSPCSSESTQ